MNVGESGQGEVNKSIEATQPLHVVFLQGKGAGHINPTIPLVAALCQHGCRP